MDMLKDMVSRMRSIWAAAKNPSDDELQRRDNVVFGNVPDDRRPSTRAGELPIPNAELLENFRLLVGIKQHSSFRAPAGLRVPSGTRAYSTSRTASNTGIYSHVVDQELKGKRNFKFFSRLINVCLGLQLVVAAALTAIGAANGSHSAVTAFGAINTVLAGVMTFLKGSGMPNRLKYFQHEWGALREYIEQRERDIIGGYSIDLTEEVEKIRTMYEAIKADVEANTPDRFVSNSGVRAAGGGGNNIAATMASGTTPSRTPSMLKIGSETDSDAIRQSYIANGQKAKHGVIDRVRELGDMEKRIESYAGDFVHDRQRDASTLANTAANAGHEQLNRASAFGAHMFDDMHGLRSRLQSKLKEVGDLEKELEHRSSVVFEQKRASATAAAQQVGQAGSDLQANVVQAAAANEAHARDALAQTADAASTAIAQRQEAARQALSDSADQARGFAHDTIDKSFDGTVAPDTHDEKKAP